MNDTRPTIICLCGSTKFKTDFERVAREQTLKGRIVFTLALFSKADGENLDPEQRTLLQHLHRHKIKMSDEILVVNTGGYIGKSTQSDIEFAQSHGKLVEFMEPLKK